MWKNLKSLFLVEEEAEAPKASPKSKSNSGKKAPSKTPSAAEPKPKPAASSSPAGTTTGKMSEKFTDVLLQAMDKANLPGFDYLEYKRALQNLRKMPMDEATRFGSAYAMAESMGVTPKKLIDSAQHYLDVLAKEQQQFQTALDGRRQAQVGDKMARQKDLGKVVTQKQAKIKEIEAEIKKLEQERAKLQKSISNSTTKLDQTEADFKTTLITLSDQIKADVGKMKEYLK